MRRRSPVIALFIMLALVVLGRGPVGADPPRLPPTPPPLVPCNPLVCLQLTDAVEVAPDTWRFEFEVLNWTAFTDRPCPATDPSCVNRTSSGLAAEGLVFVRSASLSTVPFRVLSVDANGAPLGTELVTETATVQILSGGDLGIDLNRGFVADVTRILDDTGTIEVPPACFELTDSIEGIITLSEDPPCDSITSALTGVTVDFTASRGPSDVEPNTWDSSLCTADQIIWSQNPLEDALVIPPGDTAETPCPQTCEEKDAEDNVLEGFVIEVEDFQVGDRLIFNWYLLGPSGPIASGAPPTPTDSGTLAPSPDDPWGFSFGSYQIDRKASCASGDCDTSIITTQPVTDPSLSCLVDEALDRNSLPFDIYVSLGPAGPDPPCSVEPAVVRDDKGLERLVVRATAGSETDEIVVTFSQNGNPVRTETLPLQSGSVEIPTEGLVGVFDVGGTCRNTQTGGFFFLEEVRMAIPRRGDLADLEHEALAVELDEATGAFVLTGSLPGGELDLDDQDVEVCHFVQVKDRLGRVKIFGTGSSPDLLNRHDGVLVKDIRVPMVECEPDLTLGTSADGGADCSVQVSSTAIATDPAGGFALTNDLVTGESRSTGTTIDGQEVAVQTATGVFTPGPATPVTFTVADDAGQTASCSTRITIEDDTVPVIECQLLPDEPPPGPGGGGTGGGPGGGGPPGQTGGTPGQGGGSPPGQGGGNPGGGGGQPGGRFAIVQFSATDNCDPAADLTLSADLDGVPVSNGESLQIVLDGQTSPATGVVEGGRLKIQTAGDGILTVRATDASGNVGICTTPSLR